MDRDELFIEALDFAARAHKGACRKHRDIPFILHPVEVASVAATLTEDRDVLIAALLHDTIEDAGVRYETLKERFGERVASLVQAESEEKYRELPAEQTWKRRKEESLRRLHECDDPAERILWLSDKLSNMRSFYRDYMLSGDALWQHFHQKDPKMQEWYYTRVLEETKDFAETSAWQELKWLTEQVFQKNHEA